MAVHLIPFRPSIPDVVFSATLVDTHYTFRTYWNDRDSAWYFDVLTAGGAPIALGIKIVLGAQLGKACNAEPFTSGVFLAFDTSGAQEEAGYDDLGTRVRVFYFPMADYVQTLQLAIE